MQVAAKLLKRFMPQIFFAILALTILGPLLKPGFVLTLDMVFTPNIPWPDTLSASYPFYALLHILNTVIPADLLQKLLLFFVFYGAGLGLYRLIIYCSQASAGDWSWQFAAYVAGVFYIVNPFTFTRFMVGHFALLLGVALLPWFLRTWLRLLQKPSWRLAIAAGLLMAIIAALSVHSLVFVVIIMTLATIIWLWRQRSQLQLKQYVPYVAVAFIVSAVGMSYWLVPTLMKLGYIAESLQHFTTIDRIIFATQPDTVLGIAGTILALYGFWADTQPLYVLPKDEHEWWLLPVILLWVVLLCGMVALWRKNKRMTVLCLALIMVGFIGALGFRLQFITWLADHVLFFEGMREPQKFSALLLLSYAVLLAYAAQAFVTSVQKLWKKYCIVAVVLLLIFSLTPGMLWGFGGQLQAVQYPRSWSVVNNMLRQDAANFKVLALPWHHYMNYHFVGRTLASPVDKFFDAPVIISDLPELGGLKPQVYNKDSAFITQLLTLNSTDFAAQLAARNIKYVLVIKEADYKHYNNLLKQSAFTVRYNSAEIQLLENRAWKK